MRVRAAIVGAMLGTLGATLAADPSPNGVLVAWVKISTEAGRRRADAAPIARYRDGKFEDASKSLADGDETCERLGPERFPMASLPKMTAFTHGRRLGEIVPRKIGVSSVDCTDFCVGDVELRFDAPKFPKKRPAAWGGDLLALSADVRQPPESPVSKEARAALEARVLEVARGELAPGKTPGVTVSLRQFETFSISAKETGAFALVIAKRGTAAVGSLTLVLSASSKAPLFREKGEVDADGVPAGYSLLDWIDVDGDGTNELLARFDGADLHDFVIFQRSGGIFRIAHRGGSFGC